MHKFVLKMFDFLKSSIQFFKVLNLFSIMMLILYWIQNLTGDFWAWAGLINSFMNLFVESGKYVISGSFELWGSVFELKYLGAIIIFLFLYSIIHLLYLGTCSLQELYEKGRKTVRRFEENCFNASLARQNRNEQKKINRYQVYVETQVKPKFAHIEYNVDMDEQNQILIKYLVEKTGVCPEKYEKGFLFTFDSFSEIDGKLDVFMNLWNSKAPIDFIVCIQIFGADIAKEKEQLNFLISLRFLNRVVTLADTAYRYGFNDFCKYKLIQSGVYQKGDTTIEVHEFIQND